MKELIRLYFDNGDPRIQCLDLETVLGLQINNAEIPEDWYIQLKSLKDGFYEINYSTYDEQDGDWESGYFDYEVPDEILSITFSVKSMFKFFYHYKIVPFVHVFLDIFRSVWIVDFDYGSIGYSLGPNSLHKAIRIRLFPLKDEIHWGNAFKLRLYKRCY